MRTTQISLRSGLAVAAVALPLALAVPSAVAATGITVTASGSTVTVTTTACPGGGKGSLMSNGNASFASGRQVQLTGTTASWQNVSPGTHTVAVICTDGSAAGSQTVTVGAATTPTVSSTTTPARGVRGGIGGAVEDYGTTTLVAGGALVAVAMAGGAWFVRRRTIRVRGRF
ncbi:hypothetical protein [Streptomyces aureoverticillatus]|uniref:hypothetical protein n=1 Tax=Streptomyces aureoverticillatus TaxID=66871 RepID=UPI0013DCBA9C|nr:hypothetical protein [Streptomyces aureoverticillatus]QIB47400.1 hypothetical protein G3H79_34285 [Streptomyces aureoverticillatus]